MRWFADREDVVPQEPPRYFRHVRTWIDGRWSTADQQRHARLVELLSRIEHGEVHVPAWLRATSPENRLTVAAAILTAVVLQRLLPNKYGVHPRWRLPALEIVLLVVLIAINPVRLQR